MFYADSHPGRRHGRSGTGSGQAPPAAQPDDQAVPPAGRAAQLEGQDTTPPASPVPEAPPATRAA
jgi:hypothetical protein